MAIIQTELPPLKNTMSEMKNILNGISRSDTTDEICEVQYILKEMIQYEMGRQGRQKNK